MIVAIRKAPGDILAEGAEALSHPLSDRLSALKCVPRRAACRPMHSAL